MKETDRIIDRMLDLTAGIADELLLLKDAQANRLPDGLKLKIISLAELAAIPSGDDREEDASGEEPEAGSIPSVRESDVVRSAEFEEVADAGDVPSAEPEEAPGPAASETENREPRNSAKEETEEILEMIPDEVPESSVTPPPVAAADEPSAWAKAEVDAAIAAGLVPEELQNGYQKAITRQDFCVLIWELIKQQPDYMQLLWNKPEVTFSDTDSAQVAWCAQLEIIGGVGGGRFEPYRNLKRSEAAKILALTTQLLRGENGVGTPASFGFSDQAEFGWAQPFIDYCAANDIMKGEGDAFGPNGTFSREQAMLTMLRIQQRYGK